MDVNAPAKLITAPAKLITAPAQPPATGVSAYTVLFSHIVALKTVSDHDESILMFHLTIETQMTIYTI